MIELKELPKKEAFTLVRGCELPTFKTQNMKWQQTIITTLVKEFGRKYRTPIQLIITGATKAKRNGSTGIMFPLNKNVYSKINENRPTSKLNYNLIRELIGLMEDANYLTILQGYRNSKEDKMTTCLRFHDKLLNNLDKECCDRWGESRLKYHVDLEVVDTDKSNATRKVLKNLKNIRNSKDFKDEVRMVNNNLQEHLITYSGETCCVVYKRRFEGDLQNGGRWYVVGTFQVEDKDDRNTIHIDSTPTVEIDIDQIHPSIAASILGIKLPEGYDPYDLTNYVHTPIEKKTLRTFIKPCFMALLYSKTRHTALHEIRKKLWKDKHVANWLDAETILEALEEHNTILSDFFYKKDNWKLFQYIDSQIATKVMVHFASKGEVCLGYHDSFIVTHHNKQELIRVMTNSWESVIGDLTNFSYSVEFDNTPTNNNTFNEEHPAFQEIPIGCYEER
mgnify:CR=1 FL=1|tara:strand:- start:825 stop:2171 length:1347 start_codon:yes stop_codon:yes gene_type:complete